MRPEDVGDVVQRLLAQAVLCAPRSRRNGKLLQQTFDVAHLVVGAEHPARAVADDLGGAAVRAKTRLMAAMASGEKRASALSLSVFARVDGAAGEGGGTPANAINSPTRKGCADCVFSLPTRASSSTWRARGWQAPQCLHRDSNSTWSPSRRFGRIVVVLATALQCDTANDHARSSSP